MAGFTRRTSEIVYTGRTISVGRYEYETPSGASMVREIVHHMGSVSVVPWTGSRVVLLRQYRAPVGDWIYEIPAGKRDVPGEDPIDTARRECIEEVGLSPDRLTLLHEFYSQSKNYAFWNEFVFPATEEMRRERIFRPRVSTAATLPPST